MPKQDSKQQRRRNATKPAAAPNAAGTKLAASRELWGFYLFFAACLVRLIYWWGAQELPYFDDPIVDGGTYHRAASNLAQHGVWDNVFFWQPMLYPLWLALQYWWWGPSLAAAKALQLLAGALTVSLLYRLAHPLSGRRVAAAAALAYACYLPALIYEAELLATAYETLLMVAGLLAWQALGEAPQSRKALAAGLLAAAAILIRPTFLPFIGFCLVVAFVQLGQALKSARLPAKALGRVGATLVLALSLPLLASAFLTYKAEGRFSFLPYSGGINFYLGNSRDLCATINIRPGRHWDRLQREPMQHGALTSAQQADYFYAKAWDDNRNEPSLFFKNSAAKLLRFFSGRELARNENPYDQRAYVGLAWLGLWQLGPLAFPSWFVFAFAGLGLVVLFRRVSWYVRGAVVIYPLAVCLVLVATRYRLPVMPLMIWLAAEGVAQLVRWTQQRDVRGLACGLINPVAMLVLACACPQFCEEAINYHAEMYYTLGTNSDRRGDHQQAIARYRQALALDTHHTDSLINLALAYNRLGDAPQALGLLEQAKRLGPDAKVQQTFATIYRGMGRVDEALSALEEALRLQPQFDDAWINRGELLHQQKDFQGALAAYDRAVALNPLSAIAFNNRGVTCAALNRSAEAIANFSEAVRLNPQYAEAYFNWGLTLELRGDVTGARGAYENSLRFGAGQRASERLKGLPQR